MTAAQNAAEPTPKAQRLVELRIEAIEEAADLAIPFLISVREAARAGDVAKVGECLRALWLAAVTMRQAYKGIDGGDGDGGDA